MNIKHLKLRFFTLTLFSAVSCGLAVYFLHASFHSWFHQSAEFSDRLADTVGVFFIVIFCYTVCGFTFWVLFKDVLLTFKRNNKELGANISEDEEIINSTANDLGNLPSLVHLLNEQLQAITDETERSAFKIMERMQSIDRVIIELVNLVTANLHDIDKEEVQTSVKNISNYLSRMFMEIMADIQFQDSTRQQIEQIKNALNLLDKHIAEVVSMMHNRDITNAASLNKHIKTIFDGYVMAEQRKIHLSAVGGDSLAAHADAPLPQKAELF